MSTYHCGSPPPSFLFSSPHTQNKQSSKKNIINLEFYCCYKVEDKSFLNFSRKVWDLFIFCQTCKLSILRRFTNSSVPPAVLENKTKQKNANCICIQTLNIFSYLSAWISFFVLHFGCILLAKGSRSKALECKIQICGLLIIICF